MSDFASKLKTLRLKHKQTQTELATILNVSQNAIFNWENKKREPSIDTLIKIANYYNISVSDLLGEDKADEYGWSTNEKAIDMQESIREDRLLTAFYGLNFEGQNKVIEYTEDLRTVEKYKSKETY